MSEVISDRMEDFYRELAGKQMDALWRGPLPGVTGGEPRAPYPPHHWAWSEIRPMIARAGDLVEPGPDAERRVIQLIHPALGPVRSASHTLTANVQLVLPGEVAPAHRHTIAAIRYIIEGEVAITIVDGEPIEMRPGDLVLTPGWHWHGHTNHSNGPMIWMDSLDRPLTVALRQVRSESYPDSAQPLIKAPGDADARFGSGRMRPTGLPTSVISPVYSYPWSDTEPTLARLAAVGQVDPFDDVAFDYANPLTGGHVMPTMGCRMQMIRPRTHTHAHRHAYTSVYHIFRGSGSSVVDGVRIAWSAGDFLTIPPFAWHEHHNDGSDPAYLFSTIDAPVIDALGLGREDVHPDGRQRITSEYAARDAVIAAG